MDAEEYRPKPKLLAAYYSYWSGLPLDGRFGNSMRPDRGFAAWPTNDDLTLVIAGWPYREFEANRNDVEGNFQATIDLAPAFAERLRAATREERYVGAAVRGYFRKPYGPGWALVGDAGYDKDFITAQGITDAFRDAELCAAALDQAFSGTRSFEDALVEYQSTRDAHVLWDVRAHGGVRLARARVGRAAAGPGSRAREPDSDGRLRTGHRRDDLARAVLLGGERGAHPGRGGLKPETAVRRSGFALRPAEAR